MDLSDLHKKMLVQRLEKLKQPKEELGRKKGEEQNDDEGLGDEELATVKAIPTTVTPGFGNEEDGLGTTDEIDLESGGKAYSWQDRYRPRKPRYFNRVKTAYDWNKCNKTHTPEDWGTSSISFILTWSIQP